MKSSSLSRSQSAAVRTEPGRASTPGMTPAAGIAAWVPPLPEALLLRPTRRPPDSSIGTKYVSSGGTRDARHCGQLKLPWSTRRSPQARCSVCPQHGPHTALSGGLSGSKQMGHSSAPSQARSAGCSSSTAGAGGCGEPCGGAPEEPPALYHLATRARAATRCR